jgi:hypothetical protein
LLRAWDAERVGIYELTPLRRRDAKAAATGSGVDETAFLAEVDAREAGALASKPVTLRFLLNAYQRKGGFPDTQAELYRVGCERLCEETSLSRRASRRIGTLSARQRLQVAARVAVLSILCGRPAIWTGSAADCPEGDLPLAEILGGSEPLDGAAIEINEAALRETLDSGLFSARGSERLGFAHRTYGEFLAAWYVYSRELDTTQILSLLAHPGDDAGRVVPQIQETAAWVAGFFPEVYDRIVRSDPQVLLNSDVASMGNDARERLVLWLLRLFDAGTIIDSQWNLRPKYRKLAHPGLQAQLEPVIRDRTRNRVLRRVAIDIAEACLLRPMQELLADVALDSTEDQHIREQAAAALVRVGDSQTLARLRPCIDGSAGDDPSDELKGFSLRALWPGQMSTDEMFAALTPPKQPSFLGAYASFLVGPLCECATASDLPVALRWAASQPPRDDVDYPFRHFMVHLFGQPGITWTIMMSSNCSPWLSAGGCGHTSKCRGSKSAELVLESPRNIATESA